MPGKFYSLDLVVVHLRPKLSLCGLQLAGISQLLGNLQGISMVSLLKTYFDALEVDKTRKMFLPLPSFQGPGINKCFEEK